MAEFRMPSLGADMEVGSVLEWRVKPGDVVHKGDIVAVIDTEKADIDAEVFEDGTIDELLIEPGIEVPVGTPLARISSAEPAAEQPKTAEPVESAVSPTERATGPTPPKSRPAGRRRRPTRAPSPEPSRSAATGGDGFVRATPRARRQAQRAGVDIASLAGSGPGGAVTVDDLPASAPAVEPAVESQRPTDTGPAAEPPATTKRPRRDRQASMRHAIAAAMARSKREIPHYYLATTIDLHDAMAWLTERNATRPVNERLLPAALLLKATALAAHEVPVMNGFWAETFEAADSVHLGVAVALRGGGLVAPAIHDADELSLDDVMAALRDLVGRARSGKLRSSEMSDPTITVTNLGDLGVEEVFGVIHPPQVAMVGFGRIVDRPWAVDGLLGVRPLVRATLAADHRASDGHDGGRFLAAVDRLLQRPEEL